MSTSSKKQRSCAHFAARASMLLCVEMYVCNCATYPFPHSDAKKLRSVTDGVLTECGYGKPVTPRDIAVDVCRCPEVPSHAVWRVKQVLRAWISFLDDLILDKE